MALKEELHGIHGSLKHTVQRERAAFKALEAAKESADNIVDGSQQRHCQGLSGIPLSMLRLMTSELAKVNQCSANHIKAEKKLLEEHSKELAKHLQKNNEGIWLSSGWLKFTTIVLAICSLVVILWACLKD